MLNVCISTREVSMDKLTEFYLSDDDMEAIQRGYAYVMSFDDDNELQYELATV